MTANQIAYQNMLENVRSNQAREQEQNRTNVANEDLRLQELREAQRHNVTTETETNRSNLAKELENNRHNVATESETARHNVVTEQEAGRHNRVTENTANTVARETERHNRAAESTANTVARETARHNKTTEVETKRHNVANENQAANEMAWNNDSKAKDRQNQRAIANANNNAAMHRLRYQEGQAGLRTLWETPTKLLPSVSRVVPDVVKTFSRLIPMVK